MIFTLTTIFIATTIQEPPEQVPLETPSLQWMRKTTGDEVVAIDLVSRRYEAEGKPDIWLIGVAHVAEESFYEEVTELLDTMDIVLYESVRPSGSRPPSGKTEEERVASTQKSLEFVADVAKRCAEESDLIPESMDDVIADASLIDRRLSNFVEDASVDAWSRPFVLQVNPAKSEIIIWSFGSDGEVGGTGSASDLTARRIVKVLEEGEYFSDEEDNDKGMQEEFADVLGLEFQLDALPYEEPNWFCSDLTIDEVQTEIKKRGGDPAILGTITGESFTAKIASGFLKLIPMLDSFTKGGARETAKLLMIEILSMPESEEMLEGVEPELAHVIIVDRNTEVLKDIAATIEVVENVSTIGVLYGAGHMSDLSNRLGTLLGYTPIEDKWFTAMRVNPADSLLDEKYMRQMRAMLKMQLHNARKKKEDK
ncbi:MAG: type II secretion system protein GspG [Planctomycetes bacterium]|nr:type II secretion system protein GspG [Planctomycetota bacterium]